MQVAVALVGDPKTGLISSDEWLRPWTDREQILLEVDEKSSLGAVVERAFEAFGIRLPDWASTYAAAYPFVGFQTESGTPGVTSSLDVVDDRGQIIWNVYDFDSIPYWQVVRSAEAGAIAGDASRLLIVLQPPSGNGILVDWPTLLQAWEIAWDVLERLATVAEVAGGAELLRRAAGKLRKAREAVDRNRSPWAQRGAKPHDLERILLQSDWTAESAARLLGCSESDAAAVLEVFGFSEQDGKWSRNESVDAAALDVVRKEVDYAYHMRDQEFEVLLRERLEAFAHTGERPPEESPASEYALPVLEVTGFGFSDQTVTFQARLGQQQLAATVPLWELDEAAEIVGLADRVAKRELKNLGQAASADSE